MNKRFYLDKQYLIDRGESSVSYESGAFDDMYFPTYEDASVYAVRNQYRLADNEILIVCELEED